MGRACVCVFSFGGRGGRAIREFLMFLISCSSEISMQSMLKLPGALFKFTS